MIFLWIPPPFDESSSPSGIGRGSPVDLRTISEKCFFGEDLELSGGSFAFLLCLFPVLWWASDADIDALLPPKAEITVSKFQNRVLVYGVEGGYPLFFDVDGRGSEIYPTVFALWKLPDLLPSL
ncbi:hypothetical protein V6N12_063479 [Hibiscus sabdariffa]|uniref:Pre-PUA domain-containing protein n=1 Tax=Hibiscus sabdariffa TaxID=183260 RepID=A0ABR2FBV9_9ROSI